MTGARPSHADHVPHQPTLHEWVLALRGHAIRRGTAIFFSPLPLFVLVAHSLRDGEVIGAIAFAINDGYGDPIDLDPADGEQTNRLETALLNENPSASITEILTIEFDWPPSRQSSLCLARCGETDVLVIYDAEEIPAFQAVAIGYSRDLLEYVRDEAEILLSGTGNSLEEISRVVIRKPLLWTPSDLLLIVRAWKGMAISKEQILRSDLLLTE